MPELYRATTSLSAISSSDFGLFAYSTTKGASSPRILSCKAIINKAPLTKELFVANALSSTGKRIKVNNSVLVTTRKIVSHPRKGSRRNEEEEGWAKKKSLKAA